MTLTESHLQQRPAKPIALGGSSPVIPDWQAAIAVLQHLGAPARLVQHHRLVVEAAQALLIGLQQAFPELLVNQQQVLIGAALHDVGKILYPGEITGAGRCHEQAGEEMLLRLRVSPEIARICRTHAHWTDPDAEVEDQLVALADTLWKGARHNALEETVIAAIAAEIDLNAWSVYSPADAVFERVASSGENRLWRLTQTI